MVVSASAVNRLTRHADDATLGCQPTDSQQRGLSIDRLTAGLGMRLSVGCDRKKAAAICGVEPMPRDSRLSID